MVKNPVWVTALIILVFTVGQFGETLYLPAGPAIMHTFHTSERLVQLILPAFLLGYGTSQLLWGPISDYHGRRIVILVGVFLFCIGAIFAAVSPTMEYLLLSCIIAGSGMGSAGAMCRTVLRDLYSGAKLQSVMGMVGISLVAVPLISPLVGGYIVKYLSWRAGFWFMAMLAVILLAICFFTLEETNKHFIAKQKENTNNIKKNRFNINKLFVEVMSSYGSVISNRVFMGNMLCSMLNYATIIAYEVSLPFLMQDKLKLAPVEFGWVATIPALGFLLGSMLSGKVSKLFSANNITLLAFCFTTLAALGFLIPAIDNHMSVLSLIIPMVVYMFGSGFIFASTTSEALMPFAKNAGIAAATLGLFHNVGVAISSSYISSYLTLDNQLSLALVFLALNLLMIVVFLLLVKPKLLYK